MIQKLIFNIIKELQNELAGHPLQPKVVAISIAQPIAQNLPQIAIYPGKLTITQNFKDTNLARHHTSRSVLVLREFQQELFLDIYTQDLGKLEEISSLAIGTILTNQEQLIQNNNLEQDDNSEHPTHQYQSKTISNTHTISQISSLEAIYISQEKPFAFRLKFAVIGQLKMVKTVLEEVGTIEHIEVKSDTPTPP